MNKILIVVFLMVLSTPFFAQDGYKEALIFPMQGQHVHSSSIVELPNGDLLTCWFQGSGERKANDVVVNGARLRKGQKKME